MDGKKRREQILQILKQESEPVSGGSLAKKFRVSRQVIVQDIALLRASQNRIMSTARGYLLLEDGKKRALRCFCVEHTTDEIQDEFQTIVDYGGRVLDVMVTHPIYGTIRADLVVRNRKEALDFVSRLKKEGSVPLKELTGGIHYHTVEGDTEEQLDQIEKALAQKKYLRKE